MEKHNKLYVGQRIRVTAEVGYKGATGVIWCICDHVNMMGGPTNKLTFSAKDCIAYFVELDGIGMVDAASGMRIAFLPDWLEPLVELEGKNGANWKDKNNVWVPEDLASDK